MESGQRVAAGSVEFGKPEAGSGRLLLVVDTCGPTGSVALGRISGHLVEIPGETELEGRSYSSTLVAAIGDLLKSAGAGLKDVGAIIAVYGPGSFTGVRVGLSAVKGLAEPSRIPVVAISRLEVLGAKAGVRTAALDAHRGEVFLRVGGRGAGPTEMLAGVAELKAIDPAPAQVAVCDDAAATVLAAAWPSAELVRAAPPTAADALHIAAARVKDGAFVDLALLDGNYLRRSDAEIFGEPAEARRA